jgi:hypothetical protein
VYTEICRPVYKTNDHAAKEGDQLTIYRNDGDQYEARELEDFRWFIHRHGPRAVVAIVGLQASRRPLQWNDTLVFYRSAEGPGWLREVSEFQDGRFELLSAPPAKESPIDILYRVLRRELEQSKSTTAAMDCWLALRSAGWFPDESTTPAPTEVPTEQEILTTLFGSDWTEDDRRLTRIWISSQETEG